jgi:class 3 adenylate cyclase
VTTDNRVERRLAAILAADVAGYSRLMGADEVGTLAALKALRSRHIRCWADRTLSGVQRGPLIRAASLKGPIA